MSAGIFSTRVLISKEAPTRKSDVVVVRRLRVEDVRELSMGKHDLPVGGTTGVCHESTAAIGEAARYLAVVDPEHRPSPLVPALIAMFGLKPVDACTAIAESHQIRRTTP